MLGVDDGAARGIATQRQARPDQETTLSLDNGATLAVPEGAVDQPTSIRLVRVRDALAIPYIDRLPADAIPLSAPHEVAPHRELAESAVLTLPIADKSPLVRIGIMVLDDADDQTWRLLGEAEVNEPGFASIRIDQGGIYIAVDLDRLERGEDWPKADAGLDGDVPPAHDPAPTRDPEPGEPDPGVPDLTPATKLDLLFMIDNSGSMAEEQKKLASVLPQLIKVLTTGNQNGMPSPAGETPSFPPVQSLHIGVVSSDMGVNGAPAQKSCGALSFIPTEQNTTTTNMFLNKPLGDDGQLQTSTAVAVAGIFVPPTPGAQPFQVVSGDLSCVSVSFPPEERFIDFSADITDPEDTAHKFSCIAKLGKNGCGLEQQLESVLKAFTPPDSAIKFSSGTNGQGTAIRANATSGVNGNFLRDEAILAVVFVTDEEDCSVPDSSKAIFDAQSQAVPGEINVRCGLPENQRYLHDVQKRYVAGLKALKPAAYQNRLIVTSIVGVPVSRNVAGEAVHSGTAAIDRILARPDMQFKVQRNLAMTADEPVPTCVSSKGDGSAAPARRFLELAKAFGDDGIVSSICEDEYAQVLRVLVDRIAAKL
jgi:hypothetical protein